MRRDFLAGAMCVTLLLLPAFLWMVFYHILGWTWFKYTSTIAIMAWCFLWTFKNDTVEKWAYVIVDRKIISDKRVRKR